MKRIMKQGDWVRIGTTGRKVYRIVAISTRLGVPICSLGTIGKHGNHPDAAKRVASVSWYAEDDLRQVAKLGGES